MIALLRDQLATKTGEIIEARDRIAQLEEQATTLSVLVLDKARETNTLLETGSATAERLKTSEQAVSALLEKVLLLNGQSAATTTAQVRAEQESIALESRSVSTFSRDLRLIGFVHRLAEATAGRSDVEAAKVKVLEELALLESSYQG